MKKINLKMSQFLAFSLLTLSVLSTQTAPSCSTQVAVVAAAIKSPREALSENEMKAIELLRTFMTCPLTEVPLWSKFVDEITVLLANIPKYKGLCQALLKVRGETNRILGKKRIADAITPHITNVDNIPQDITDAFTKMGLMERLSRIKLS